MSTLLLGNTLATPPYSLSTGNLILSKFTAVASGSLTEMKVDVDSSVTGRLAIYSDVAGAPSALLLDTGDVSLVPGVNTLTVSSVSITNGTTYWLGCQINGGSMGYDSGGSGGIKYKSFTYGAFPDPAGSGYSDLGGSHVSSGYSVGGGGAPVFNFFEDEGVQLRTMQQDSVRALHGY